MTHLSSSISANEFLKSWLKLILGDSTIDTNFKERWIVVIKILIKGTGGKVFVLFYYKKMNS